MSEKINLTVEQCAKQFESYAASNPNPESVHQLKFCAGFIREFCSPEKELLTRVERMEKSLGQCFECRFEADKINVITMEFRSTTTKPTE